jgi:SAM-dependent methyltransferase
MARHFADVLAIDPDPEMVALARRTAAKRGLANVEVRQMRAEDLSADIAPLRAAIFGASFHWTDRPRVADAIYDLLVPHGSLVVLSPGGTATDWEGVIRATLARHLGAERRAGGGVYRAGERHEQVLGRSRFRTVETADIAMRQQWSVDEIMGFLASTSYASRAVLGDRAAAFDADLRASLQRFAAQGPLEKLVEYAVIIARR